MDSKIKDLLLAMCLVRPNTIVTVVYSKQLDYLRPRFSEQLDNGSKIQYIPEDTDHIRGRHQNYSYIVGKVDYELYFRLAQRTSDIIFIDYDPDRIVGNTVRVYAR